MNDATSKLWDEIKALGEQKSKTNEDIKAKREELKKVCDHTWGGKDAKSAVAVLDNQGGVFAYTTKKCMVCGTIIER
jgi:hypothetical protein